MLLCCLEVYMANGKEDKGRKGKTEPWVWDLLEWQSQERVAVTTTGAVGGEEHTTLRASDELQL